MSKVSKKKEIIEKSAQLFREKGYAASSVRDIATAVNLEPSSLYSHIKSKEELLFAICMECASHYNNAMDDVLNANIYSGIEKLKNIMFIHIDLALNDPTSSTVFSDEWKHLPHQMLEHFIAERKSYEKKFLLVLQELMEKNVVIKSDPIILMNTLISGTRWLHYTKKKYTEKEKDEIKEVIMSTMFTGIINQ
jgi:TetR/AcrR family transcriptional regulator, cholesterol catabolism regulator